MQIEERHRKAAQRIAEKINALDWHWTRIGEAAQIIADCEASSDPLAVAVRMQKPHWVNLTCMKCGYRYSGLTHAAPKSCPNCGESLVPYDPPAQRIASLEAELAQVKAERDDAIERADAAGRAIMGDDLKLAKSLHINYCEDLIKDGAPWEVTAEPEPSYFESLHDAIVFLVNLPDTDAERLFRELAVGLVKHGVHLFNCPVCNFGSTRCGNPGCECAEAACTCGFDALLSRPEVVKMLEEREAGRG